MARFRGCLALAAAGALLGGCGTTAPPKTSLEGNILSAQILPTQEPQPAEYHYGLYRLAPSREVSDPSSRRHGKIRLADGVGGPTYVVEARALSYAQLDDGRLRFELPALMSDNRCYAVVSVAGAAMPLAEAGSVADRHFIDLGPYHDYVAREGRVERLQTESERHRSERATRLAAIRDTEQALAGNAAWVGGRCELPNPTPPPPRPADAVERWKAQDIAVQELWSHAVDKLGCTNASRLFHGSRLWTMTRSLDCEALVTPSHLSTADMRPLLNLLRNVVLECPERYDSACTAQYFEAHDAEFEQLMTALVEPLHGPLRAWEQAVEDAETAPQRLWSTCRTLAGTLTEHRAALKRLDETTPQDSVELSQAKQQLGPAPVLAGDVLACPSDGPYRNRLDQLHFVAPRKP